LKISIITVCYNSEAFIASAIDSVLSQSYSNIEYIVIDGNSNDSTLSIIQSYGDCIAKVVSEPDEGIYDAMNKGINLATGDVIGILNSDDFYIDNFVLAQVSEVFANSEIDACYADLIYVHQQDTNKVLRYWKSRTFVPGLFKRGWMPAHPTFFVRREIYEELGNFDLSYKFQADFELTMRFMEVYRIKTEYIPKIFIKMRVGGKSNNSIINIVKGNIEAYKACKKNYLFVLSIFSIVKMATRIPQFFSRPTDYK
jgi:glycosyltransferase involved in cell wall biosynthesis